METLQNTFEVSLFWNLRGPQKNSEGSFSSGVSRYYRKHKPSNVGIFHLKSTVCSNLWHKKPQQNSCSFGCFLTGAQWKRLVFTGLLWNQSTHEPRPKSERPRKPWSLPFRVSAAIVLQCFLQTMQASIWRRALTLQKMKKISRPLPSYLRYRWQAWNEDFTALFHHNSKNNSHWNVNYWKCIKMPPSLGHLHLN